MQLLVHLCCCKIKSLFYSLIYLLCLGLFSERSGSVAKDRHDEGSHLAVVACGPRLEETLIMLKSALLFSKKLLHFYIFAEDELHDSFRDEVSLSQEHKNPKEREVHSTGKTKQHHGCYFRAMAGNQ